VQVVLQLYHLQRGVEHRPVSVDGAAVVVGPSATLSTGDCAGRVPALVTAARGLPLS